MSPITGLTEKGGEMMLTMIAFLVTTLVSLSFSLNFPLFKAAVARRSGDYCKWKQYFNLVETLSVVILFFGAILTVCL